MKYPAETPEYRDESNVETSEDKKTETLKREALDYHRYPFPGKIETVAVKDSSTPLDLSLAYSPGVAYPSMEIEKHPEDSYLYTNRGNLVGVISNGSAVLGLGNIGAEAAKPVMEGKALLFKTFADLDSYDIEVNASDVGEFVRVVKAISPTFGGINLEDIKAPECFEIERRLQEECDIPIMHDDQHGTAIVSGAALLNALEIKGKKISEARIVVNGAGAAAISCTRLYEALGAEKENIVMCDSKGVITTSRKDLNIYKQEFATSRDIHTLADALKGADVFVGVSVADVMTPEMLRSMAPGAIVFALANPNPEIKRELALSSRDDIIYATGRSDYPNQINNLLAFPYIFRGALDCRASKITIEMKLAAAKAIAELAHRRVPQEILDIYKLKDLTFGPDYILPKPFDHRLMWEVPPAVVIGAELSGVARKPIKNIPAYRKCLQSLIKNDNRHLCELLKRG